MIKTKIKRRYFILIHIVLIFFLCFLLIIIYANKTSKKITIMANKYYEREMNMKLNQIIKELSKSNNVDILKIKYNEKGEIISADYDLNKSYHLLEIVTSNLRKKINQKDLKYFTIKLPFLVNSNNVFLMNYGPKITIKMYYMDTIITNVKTKITNYGINNALVEAYIVINLDGQLITPLEKNDQKLEYELLISSKIINGRVPELYGKSLTVSSFTFDIPIES